MSSPSTANGPLRAFLLEVLEVTCARPAALTAIPHNESFDMWYLN